ncbi:MAG: hypothetical protein GTO62_18745 [Planctomycetales bacterium]|nr:hypothetical protein [Planctomycetales bacterium]NIP70779.1 hypothetical protein [Planctomycetales bacterium]
MVEHSSSTRVAGQTAWQSTTLVILENLHQLSRQRSAQRQLASLIDRLERVGGKLIVTSQTAPAACEQLSPMLSSRLNAGLVINLLAPQAAARRALVRSQARHRGIPLTEGAVSQLAARLASCSVAELLRTMDRLAASEGSASTEPAALDEAVVRRFFHLDPQAARPPVPLPLGRIFRLVARQYSVTTADLRGRSRRRSVALARSMAMYVASRYARYSLKKIGTSLGKRDHTTVMHGCQNIEKLLHTDANCRQALQQIVAEIEAESAPIPLPEPSIPRPGGP